MSGHTFDQLPDFAPSSFNYLRVASLVTGISILALKGGK